MARIGRFSLCRTSLRLRYSCRDACCNPRLLHARERHSGGTLPNSLGPYTGRQAGRLSRPGYRLARNARERRPRHARRLPVVWGGSRAPAGPREMLATDETHERRNDARLVLLAPRKHASAKSWTRRAEVVLCEY